MADYWVVKNKTAGWDVKRSGAECASPNHATQREATDAAHP